MKAEVIKKEIVYKIELDQDELDLLTSILGDQMATQEVKHIFRVLEKVGGEQGTWRPQTENGMRGWYRRFN